MSSPYETGCQIGTNSGFPVIFGLSGPTLLPEEKAFFTAHQPAGYILFDRNIEAPDQVRSLIAELKTLSEEPSHFLVDQEGGRVQRVRFLGDYPEAASFEATWRSDPEGAVEAVRNNYAKIGAELADLGFTVDCAPVLDLRQADAHDIIGARAFSEDPACITALATAACEGLLASGITPVIKHIPGHGRALADSHLELPTVDVDLETLTATDFTPFKDLAGHFEPEEIWAMTAHITYPAIDASAPATLSQKVIRTIREDIGFKGTLVSDDLDMKALSGSYQDRVHRALSAGCDLLLQCNGEMEIMEEVAAAVQNLEDPEEFRGAAL